MNPGGLSMRAARRAFSLGLLLALVFSGSALAQHQGQRQGRGAQQQQQAQGAARPMPPTGGARDANWRNGQTPQRQPGRMSDDERQQLRRDISDHGRDIYRDRSAQNR